MTYNQFYIEDAVAGYNGLTLFGTVTYGFIQPGMKCVNFLDREVRIVSIEVSGAKVDSAISGQRVSALSLSGAEYLEMNLTPGTTLRFAN